MTQDFNQPLRIATKLLLAWVVLSALGYFYGQNLVDLMLPLMRGFAQNITDDFYINFAWQKENTRMLMIDANFGIPKVSIQALGINAGATISAGTNIEHILVPLILLFLLVLCWPLATFKHRGLLLLLALPAAVITLLLTTPFLLVGKVESLLQEQASTMRVIREKPLYLDWMLFTEVGGRWLLPISLGLLCVWLLNSLFIPKENDIAK